jgi:PilZ domain
LIVGTTLLHRTSKMPGHTGGYVGYSHDSLMRHSGAGERGKRSTMEFRRRVPRQVAGWIGSCHVVGEPTDEVRPCRVLDVSELGLGLVLGHPLGTGLVGRRMTVETPTTGISVNVPLEGEIKNATPLENGTLRIGMEFGGLTELEHSLVKALGVLSGMP